MARISELHCIQPDTPTQEGVEAFLEVALTPSDSPKDFIVSFYHADGSVGLELPLSHPDVLTSIDVDTHSCVAVITASRFPVLHSGAGLTGFGSYVGFALTHLRSGDVMDFRDILRTGKTVLALDGAAAGNISQHHSAARPEGAKRTRTGTQSIPIARGKGVLGVACFVSGTRIRTEVGYQLIDTLREGDLIWTRDNGLQPLRWMGQRSLSGLKEHAPIQIAQETFGAIKPHWVSPDHLLLLTGWRAELTYGEKEVLVPARALVDACDVRVSACTEVTYCHLAFDAPQIVSGDGVLSQTFHPDSAAVVGMNGAHLATMVSLFPELATAVHVYGRSKRPSAPATLGPLLSRPH